MPHTCLFCDIARGRSAAAVVAETRSLIAFADCAPIRPGHLQIVPRAHHACFDDLPPALAGQVIRLGQRLARGLKARYGVARVAFLFTGGDVAHAHAHLVPMVAPDDITSRRYITTAEIAYAPRPQVPLAQLRGEVAALRAVLDQERAR